MAKEAKGISFNPDTYLDGGGLLDNVDVKWKELRFVTWDYDGKVPSPVPALRLTLEVEDMEGDVEQYYSIGNPQDWEPSKDGRKIIARGKATGINKNSNFGILMTSLVDAGFPKDKMDSDDCTIFEGLECHMVRVKAPERKGLVQTPRADGRVYEKTVLVVDSIKKLPGGKAVAKGKTEEGEDEVEARAEEVIMEVLAGKPNGMDKKQLAQEVLNMLKGDPLRNAVLKLAYSDEFLSGDRPWSFNKGRLSL